MTRAQIRTEVRSNLGDLNSVKFTDAAINQWIDLATDQLIAALDFDSAMATINTVEGEPNYQLPSNAMGINEVYVTASDNKEYRIPIVTQDELNTLYGVIWRNDPNSRAQVAYKADYNVLGLYPPPNAANAGKTIRIFYDRQSSNAASDSDSPIYLPALHMANVHWSAQQGFLRLRDLEAAKLQANLYGMYLKQSWHNAQTFAKEMWQWRFG